MYGVRRHICIASFQKFKSNCVRTPFAVNNNYCRIQHPVFGLGTTIVRPKCVLSYSTRGTVYYVTVAEITSWAERPLGLILKKTQIFALLTTQKIKRSFSVKFSLSAQKNWRASE